MSQSISDKFTIACPQCGEIVTVSRAHVGKKGRCAVCHKVFPIEAPDGVVHRPPAPAPQLPQAAARNDDDPFRLVEEPTTPSHTASFANDQLKQARDYKGPAIAQEENDTTY